MRDVCERAAVHDGGSILKRLDQVRLNCLLQQSGHRAFCFQIPGVNGLAVIGIGHKNIAEALLEVGKILRETENRHNLRGNRNDESILARHAVHLAAQADDDIAKSPVVHIEASLDQDAARVDPQLVALLHMVIEHRAEQIVRRGNGMHIARKMKVNILHRYDLCITAARSSALNTEHPGRATAPAEQ